VQKFYFALTIKAPNPQEGKLKHFLLKDESRNVVQAYPKPYRDAKESITHYETMGKQEAGYLLKITPLTGRPHQIRVQLSAIGCPILGDLKYGAPKALPDASIGLHCFQMELMHPVRQEPLVVEAPLPDGEWWRP